MLENEHFFCSPFEALYFNNLQRRNTLESAQYRTPRSWMIQRQGWLIILSSERVYDQLMLALSRWNFLFNIRKNHYNYCGYVVVTIKHKCTLYIYMHAYIPRGSLEGSFRWLGFQGMDNSWGRKRSPRNHRNAWRSLRSNASRSVPPTCPRTRCCSE